MFDIGLLQLVNINNASRNGKMNEMTREKGKKKNMDSGLLALLRAEGTTYPNIFPSPLSEAVQYFISRLFLFFISFTPSSTLLRLLN